MLSAFCSRWFKAKRWHSWKWVEKLRTCSFFKGYACTKQVTTECFQKWKKKSVMVPPALLCIPSVFLYLSSLVSPFTWSRPACEYLNDINRVVITLTPVMAEALLRGTVLTTLCHPQALTPTPINTYEYWQRPAISIITFQDCVSASATDNFRSQQVRVSVGLLFSSSWKDMQANPVSSFLHYLNDQYEWELRGHTRPVWPPPSPPHCPGLVKDKQTKIHGWNVDE